MSGGVYQDSCDFGEMFFRFFCGRSAFLDGDLFARRFVSIDGDDEGLVLFDAEHFEGDSDAGDLKGFTFLHFTDFGIADSELEFSFVFGEVAFATANQSEFLLGRAVQTLEF